MTFNFKDGFEVQINERCLNDWKFLTLLHKVDKGDAAVIVDVAESLLGGADEVEKLATHLEMDGITPVDSMVAAITEIIEGLNELKNSQSSPA